VCAFKVRLYLERLTGYEKKQDCVKEGVKDHALLEGDRHRQNIDPEYGPNHDSLLRQRGPILNERPIQRIVADS
jgi:hypothetical protein